MGDGAVDLQGVVSLELEIKYIKKNDLRILYGIAH